AGEAGIAKQRSGGTALRQVAEETLERRGFAVHVAHAVLALLAQLRPRGGIGDRVGPAAERIDQSAFARLRAAPDPATGHGVDLRDAPVAALGHSGYEIAVTLFDHGLDHLPHARVQRAADVEGARERGGAYAVGVHADLVEGPRDRREHAEDADRSGDGRWIGIDAVGVHADPVAAGRGHVAHGHDHG